MTFLTELARLREAATKGPCKPYVVSPQSATDNFYEPYSPWISGGFPKAVQVGRGLCIAANDMAYIAYLVNHAEAIEELVRVVDLQNRNWHSPAVTEALEKLNRRGNEG